MAGNSRQNGGIMWLFIGAGLFLMLAGVLSLLPTVGVVAPESAPSDFGEEEPPVRPTVTPLPRANQITSEPMLLPDASDPSIQPGLAAPQAAADSTFERTGGSPMRLVIPAIGLNTSVEPVGWHLVNSVSQWDVPDHFAAGWLKTSALLGEPGNTVLTGHHNIAGQVFRYLVNLKAGDEIEVDTYGQPYFYKITTRKIVREQGQPEAVRLENAKWMLPTDDERLTLITCWPYTGNTHRLIIVARPFDPERGSTQEFIH